MNNKTIKKKNFPRPPGCHPQIISDYIKVAKIVEII
jgi:hypothetical protein